MNILARRHHATLADFACSSVLLGFDYDGTLAPIVSAPARARMRAATRRLLVRVARCYPCVVISGRAHEDLSRRLGRLPLWHLIGNHGLEPWAETRAGALRVQQWARQLHARLARYPGVVVEDKTHSITVHYRQSRNKDRARRVIGMVARGLPDARLVDGRLAVNLILRDGPDKGVALQRSRQILGCETAIYVGDDGTDEDAFVSGPPGQLLAIRVGAARKTRAQYYLTSQRDIDLLLRALLVLRQRQGSGPSARPARERRDGAAQFRLG